MKRPSQTQINSALRAAGVTAGTIGTIATLIGLLTADQANALVVALQKWLTDLQQLVGDSYVVAGLVFPIAVTFLAKLGWNAASPIKQAASVQSSPTEQVLTVDPKVAAADPGIKLVDKLPV